MILYHGSNTAIDGIDLNRCRPYKDFGRGFYLTDIREQAQRMAARTARMFSGNPTLTMFEFDLEEAQSSELKVKVFKEPDWEWARFCHVEPRYKHYSALPRLRYRNWPCCR